MRAQKTSMGVNLIDSSNPPGRPQIPALVQQQKLTRCDLVTGAQAVDVGASCRGTLVPSRPSQCAEWLPGPRGPLRSVATRCPDSVYTANSTDYARVRSKRSTVALLKGIGTVLVQG